MVCEEVVVSVIELAQVKVKISQATPIDGLITLYPRVHPVSVLTGEVVDSSRQKGNLKTEIIRQRHGGLRRYRVLGDGGEPVRARCFLVVGGDPIFVDPCIVAVAVFVRVLRPTYQVALKT